MGDTTGYAHPNLLGTAMADGIKAMTYASEKPYTEDADGLIPSDHIGVALGNALERGGARRIK